ncbi:hypothetical protein MCUN1_000196 [Malassezia cuniculi]|uniref:RNase III domain-containing protein n=1 Tax=Malassezia cuniculi TaxID=948313 RepID=A0AAF0EVG7_9BASI|nr:hypothetical protein MCUN1_000196 [Malassezia cuniculi]
MASRTFVRLAARQRVPAAPRPVLCAYLHTEAPRVSHQTPDVAPKPFGNDLTPKDMLIHLNDVSFSAYKSASNPGLFGSESFIAQLALTHESWSHGAKGHNRRFAFLGRRAITSSLNILLYDISSGSGDAAQFARSLMVDSKRMEALLDTRSLGARAGRELGLEKVMRWQPTMLVDPEHGKQETGLYKVRGRCLEAVVGAIMHYRGAHVAQLFFHERVLPALDFGSVPEEFRSIIRRKSDDAAKELSQLP